MKIYPDKKEEKTNLKETSKNLKEIIDIILRSFIIISFIFISAVILFSCI